MKLSFLLAAFCVLTVNGQEAGYKKPRKEILDILNAPSTPQASVSPAKTHILLTRSRRYPPIAEVSQPMLRLAGLRINPRNNGLHLPPTIIELMLKRIDDGKDIPMTFPQGARMSAPRWSPDGKWFA
ncbi:MAG: PD40 domain-containing protein, partial [Bryobacterales bacterium]|nr:PD40 domain-containing protein [Bryobacterales bacterium]